MIRTFFVLQLRWIKAQSLSGKRSRTQSLTVSFIPFCKNQHSCDAALLISMKIYLEVDSSGLCVPEVDILVKIGIVCFPLITLQVWGISAMIMMKSNTAVGWWGVQSVKKNKKQ